MMSREYMSIKNLALGFFLLALCSCGGDKNNENAKAPSPEPPQAPATEVVEKIPEVTVPAPKPVKNEESFQKEQVKPVENEARTDSLDLQPVTPVDTLAQLPEKKEINQ